MPNPVDRHNSLNPERELDRIVELPEASRLSSLSVDTIKRRHADKLIKLSPRRVGIRLRDALMLSEQTA
jgi:hypothetical protein